MSNPNLPPVAVVTPVYNGAAYLAETLESVQAQTYPNLTHVVLDNASTDATPEILRAFAGRRVPLLVSRNETLLPIMANWNAAFARAPKDARYLRLLCGDDTIDPDSIAACVRLAEQDPQIALVAHNHRNGDQRDEFGWPPGETILDGPELARGFFENRLGFFATHALFRADLVSRREPFFDPALLGADFEAVLFLARQGKVGLIDRDLGWTRVHEASVTNTVQRKRNTHFRDWLVALHRHGPAVFDAKAFKALSLRYQRYYLSRIVRWRLRHGAEASAAHIEALRAQGCPVGVGALADAMVDRILIRLGVRADWRGWPN